jgi:subtilisin family serine protease
MNEWLVVRRPRATRSGALESAEPIAMTAAATESPRNDEPKITREEAPTRTDLPDRQHIDTAAPSMPMSVIRPLPKAATDPAFIAKAKQQGATWGLCTLGVDPNNLDGGGVKVAIIDTGIKRSHPAFAHMPQNAIVEMDFTVQPGGIEQVSGDADGHGTHCAATVCGGTVNGIRIGVAPKIDKLLVAKAIGGTRGSAALLDALNWAVTNKADVISMSLGFDFIGYQKYLVNEKGYEPEAAMSMALTAFRDNIRVFDAWMELLRTRRKQGFDPLVVAATGNESDRPKFVVDKASPSEAEGIIAVGAINEALEIARFSNVNPTFVGPGVNVLSAGIEAELTVMSGTSMACPHIAGLAALYWQFARVSGQATAERILRMMANSAEKNRNMLRYYMSADYGAGMPRAPGI